MGGLLPKVKGDSRFLPSCSFFRSRDKHGEVPNEKSLMSFPPRASLAESAGRKRLSLSKSLGRIGGLMPFNFCFKPDGYAAGLEALCNKAYALCRPMVR